MSISSVPIGHWIKGAVLLIALTVFWSFSYKGFRFAFGGTTLPDLGFGIFPLGPNTLPNAVATFGIMFACAIKKSNPFATFLMSFLSLYFWKSSDIIVKSKISFACCSSSGPIKAHTFTFFPLECGNVTNASIWCSCFFGSIPFKFMIKS